MNAKNLTKSNIQNFGYVYGKSIRGKGIEIFQSSSYGGTLWYSDNQKDKDNLIEKLNPSELYVKECRVVSEDGSHMTSFNFDQDFASSLKKFEIKKIFESNFEGFDYVSFYKIPKFVGYISVSKYKSDLESQKELIIDLLALEGKNVAYDDYDYYNEDDVMNFNSSSGNYSSEWGGSIAEDTGDCVYVDGRLSEYNSSVVDDFWTFRDDEHDYYKEIDPDETISVYHRKGKDWYVGYSLESLDVCIAYKEEDYDYDSPEDFDEFTGEYLVYSPNRELLDKFVASLESDKKWLEIKSYIYNELRVGEYDYPDWSYNDNIFNLRIADNEFEDRFEFGYAIMDYIDSPKNNDVKSLVKDAYDKLLQKNIKDDVLFEKYTHLKILRNIVENEGKELVYSKIGSFTEDKAYAIKFKNEEYHFSLQELYSSNPKEFYSNVSGKLTKRLYERYENSILLEKAKYVFVGLEDSYESGNCNSGTASWVKTHHIDTDKIGGIRGDEILKLDYSNYTKRAVMQAIKTHGGLAS